MSPVLIGVLVAVIAFIGFSTWKAPRLTSVIFWALAATIFFTAALLIKAPGPFSEKALWITIFVPVVWVIFQWWSYWDRKAWRVAAGLMIISIVSGAIVFLSEPMV
ncbi:MAG: hypothetical protein AAFR27_11710, partial [Pseudomonadota bacterium]